MITIPKVIRNSSNGEVDATTKAIIVVLTKKNWDADPFLTNIIDQLEATEARLNEAIKQGQAESDLEEFDLGRDKALSELFNLVKGFASISDEAGNGARTLMNILDRYGLSKTTNSNYANESAYINSLLTDLKESKIAPLIEGLPFVNDAITRLQTAQTKFEQAYDRYMEAMASFSTKNSASSIKTEVVKIINSNLVDYLKTMVKVNSDLYLSTATAVSEIIKDNNERVKSRRVQASKAEASPNESEPS